MLKFLYRVTDEDYSFIHVWKARRGQNLEDGKTFRYITESELKDYIEKYPHSMFTYSTWIEKLKMKKLEKKYNCSLMESLQFSYAASTEYISDKS